MWVLYGSINSGCLGIPLTAFDSEVARIDTAFKLLMSDDSNVKSMAWDDLRIAVKNRANHDPSLTEMEEFLSNTAKYKNQSRVATVGMRAKLVGCLYKV